MRRGTGIVLFILANVLLLSLGLGLGLREPLAELDRLWTANRLMESRLSIKERHLAAQPDNQLLIEAFDAEAAAARVILSYDRLGAALDEVRQSAQRRALTETASETREPVTLDTENSGGWVAEIKVEVAYTGAYDDICVFVEDLLANRAGFRTDRLTIAVDPTHDGLSNARLDFYIYAAEAGVSQS